jgi:protease IV
MSFMTASAILRGKWLIDQQWAAAHMPLVAKLVNGEAVDFGFKKDESTEAKLISAKKAGSLYQVGYFTDLSRLPSGSIAMLTIAGPIIKYGDACSYGSVDHIATINRLGNAPNVAGIILNIDSPGGEASGTAAFARAIKEVGKVKPVIGLVDDGIAASAAMWIISACTEIYVTQKTDMVGSIGAYQTLADWYGYMAEQGLKVRDIYAPQSTEKNIEYRQALQGNDTLIEEDLKVLVDDFIATVRTNRAGKIQGDAWSHGKMFYTKDALKLGLIDGQKPIDQVIKRMDQLISTSTTNSPIINSNTMSLTKTFAAAGAAPENFKTVGAGTQIEEAGILVQMSHLENIEAALTAADTAAATHATELSAAATAQKKAEDDLAAAKVEAQSAATQATADLAAANTSITEKDTRIAELEAEVATLKASPAGEMQNTSTANDASIVESGKGKKKSAFDEYADSVLGAPRETASDK